uniref:TOG domain-containing protein n=3 Tax=Macrostomum lignano TaxID=282301 RepID=A0A1I8ILX3_9PLAT
RLLLQFGKWRYPSRMEALLNDLLNQRQLAGPFADSESIRSSRRACLCHCLDCLGDSAAKAFLAALNESPVESAAFKTLIWALANHLSVLRKPLPRLVCGSIGPLCRALQSVKTDDDKIKSCLQHLPAVLVLAKDSGLLAESLSAALSDTTRWQGRRAALNLLQGLAYHNAFQLDPGKLRALVLDRLSDPTVEVRECASQALGGLMACGLCEWTDELLHQMGRMTQSKDPVVK